MPLCFSKSADAVVVMVAVSIAGRSFVLVDPLEPPERLGNIIENTGATGATVALVAPGSYKAILRGLSQNDRELEVYVVDDDNFSDDSDDSLVCSTVGLYSPGSVIFTSGSTGKPKGMIVEHCGTSVTATSYRFQLYIGQGTRGC